MNGIRSREVSSWGYLNPTLSSNSGLLKRLGLCILVIGYGAFLSGCAEIQAPTATEVLTRPFGTQAPFQRGATKAEVLEAWGKPDHVISLGVDELGNPKEEWIYTGRLPGLPIDYEYVSKTKHLIFEGENLVRWKSEESPGSAEAETAPSR